MSFFTENNFVKGGAGGLFGPDEIAAMRRVFNAICEKAAIPTDDAERREMLAHLIINKSKYKIKEAALLETLSRNFVHTPKHVLECSVS